MFPLFVLALFSVGYLVEAQDACGSSQPQVTQIFGTGLLYSPGYTENGKYPDNVVCSYQLHAPAGMSVRVQFNDFDVDPTDSCGADSLQVYDFDSSGRSVILGTHCGRNQTIPDYVTKSHVIHLSFKSDPFAGGRGFKITFSLQSNSDLCASNQITCRNRNCVSSSSKCDGIDDCGDGTDEEKCGFVPSTAACGRPEISPKALANYDRIVGGTSVVPGSWPWMASLQDKNVHPCGHFCGGSVINAQWVVTAAHCFKFLRRASDIRVHIGSHSKFQKDPEEQIRLVERFIIYDDIPPAVFEQNGVFDIVNDVALIKLNAPIKFGKFVKPVCLPGLNAVVNQTSRCYATGWGTTRGSGSSEVLKQAFHPIQSGNTCTRLVGGQFVPDTMICAGSMQPKDGVCHGDSGGPLVCEVNKFWSVYGVASYVTGSNHIEGLCGISDRPSVFNNVARKIDWIKKMMNKYG